LKKEAKTSNKNSKKPSTQQSNALPQYFIASVIASRHSAAWQPKGPSIKISPPPPHALEQNPPTQTLSTPCAKHIINPEQ
jgi:hypothetical protein